MTTSPEVPASAADVTAVIPFLEQPQRLRRCCDALGAGTVAPPVVVVDNASSEPPDGLPGRVRVLRLDRNRGFAAAANAGLGAVTTPWALLLNDDAEVAPDAVERLLAAAAGSPRVAAVQPKILTLDPPFRFDHAGGAGGFLDAFGYPFARGRVFATVEVDRGQHDRPMDVFWASGACSLLRRDAVLAAGGFDERFFAHMEEIDLCWRLWRRGWRVLAEPSAVVHHQGGGTLPAGSTFKTYLNHRNGLWLLMKNEPTTALAWKLPVRLALDLAAGLYHLAQGRGAAAGAVLRGTGAALASAAGFVAERPRRGPDGWQRAVRTRRCLVVDYWLRDRRTFTDVGPV